MRKPDSESPICLPQFKCVAPIAEGKFIRKTPRSRICGVKLAVSRERPVRQPRWSDLESGAKPSTCNSAICFTTTRQRGPRLGRLPQPSCTSAGLCLCGTRSQNGQADPNDDHTSQATAVLALVHPSCRRRGRPLWVARERGHPYDAMMPASNHSSQLLR
jgi:hypothetical protein